MCACACGKATFTLVLARVARIIVARNRRARASSVLLFCAAECGSRAGLGLDKAAEEF